LSSHTLDRPPLRTQWICKPIAIAGRDFCGILIPLLLLGTSVPQMNSPAWSAPPGLRHRVAEHPVQFDYTMVRKHRQLFAEGPDIQFKWLGPETVVNRADGGILY
jgi:hypothetical protein